MEETKTVNASLVPSTLENQAMVPLVSASNTPVLDLAPVLNLRFKLERTSSFVPKKELNLLMVTMVLLTALTQSLSVTLLENYIAQETAWVEEHVLTINANANLVSPVLIVV